MHGFIEKAGPGVGRPCKSDSAIKGPGTLDKPVTLTGLDLLSLK